MTDSPALHRPGYIHVWVIRAGSFSWCVERTIRAVNAAASRVAASRRITTGRAIPRTMRAEYRRLTAQATPGGTGE